MASTGSRKRVMIESPKSSTVSYANPLSTPSRKAQQDVQVSPGKSDRKVLLVSTPSFRNHGVANCSLFSDRKLAVAVSPTRAKSPSRPAVAVSPSKLREPHNAHSLLKIKPQRDNQLAMANSAKKTKEAEVSMMTPSRSALGKPQRLFPASASRNREGLLCMSESRETQRRGGVVRRNGLSPPRLGGNLDRSTELPVGLKSPARRLNSSVISKSARKSPSNKSSVFLSSVSLSPPKMAPLSASRATDRRTINSSPTRAARSNGGQKNDENRMTPARNLDTPTKKHEKGTLDVISEADTKKDHDSASTALLEQAYDRLNIQDQSSASTRKELEEDGTKNEDSVRHRSTARDVTTKVPIKPPHMTASISKDSSTSKASGTRKPVGSSLPRMVVNRQTSVKPKAGDSKPQSAKTTEPLSGVTAYLDIRTDEGDDASATFKSMLCKLGAKVVRQPSRSVTHIVFKRGSPKTLHTAQEMNLSCLSISWIIECNKQQKRIPESDFVVEAEAGAKYKHHRRRKSLEPKALPVTPQKKVLQQKAEPSSDPITTSANVSSLSTPPAELAHQSAHRVPLHSPSHTPRISSPLAKKCWKPEDLEG
ncbi:hypothetical protein BZA70DRAFT_294916 [Myxozyma melibiosi]|uniref:BRCT domain-containing protein n=1 Tax=Myxozyma melibiosi TaxID=54550 RepID=A0ABR1F7L8_9ASCO